MIYSVVFSPEAKAQLSALYRYIADAASPPVAAKYINAILKHCEQLQLFPHRGTSRDDVRPGLRTTHYRKRTVIAFSIDEEHVSILGIFYGGQNFEMMLTEE